MLSFQVLLRLPAACCVVGCCFVTACYSADGFISKELRVDGRLQSITFGDFNGDARPDIAVRTLEDLSVLLNTSAGTFSSPVRTALRYGSALAGVTDYGVGRAEVAADFNSDGNLDLAIRDRNEILFGVGDGTFLPPQAIAGEHPTFYGLTATGDFNGDQKADLVFFVRGSLVILLGNGDGSFRSGGTADLGGDGQLAITDLDRDGRSDLAYLRYKYHSSSWDPNCCDLQVYLSQSEGSFRDMVPISGIVAGGVLAVDLNKDGIPDIATANAVLLGNGDGSFQNGPRLLTNFTDIEEDLEIFYATPAGPVAAADLDSDTHVDLVGISLNNSEGKFVVGIRGEGPRARGGWGFHLWERADRRVVGISDLDGDGRPDVVTAVYCPLVTPGGVATQWYQLGVGCTDRSNNITMFLNRIEVAPR